MMKKYTLTLLSLSLVAPVAVHPHNNDTGVSAGILGALCTAAVVIALEQGNLTSTRHTVTSGVAGTGTALSAAAFAGGLGPISLGLGAIVGGLYYGIRPDQRRLANEYAVQQLRNDKQLPLLQEIYTYNEETVVKKLSEAHVKAEFPLLKACKSVSDYLTRTEQAHQEFTRLAYYPYFASRPADETFLNETTDVTQNVLATAKSSNLYIEQKAQEKKNEELELKRERNSIERRKADAQQQQADADTAREIRAWLNWLNS